MVQGRERVECAEGKGLTVPFVPVPVPVPVPDGKARFSMAGKWSQPRSLKVDLCPKPIGYGDGNGNGNVFESAYRMRHVTPSALTRPVYSANIDQ